MGRVTLLRRRPGWFPPRRQQTRRCHHCNRCMPTIYSGTRCVVVEAAQCRWLRCGAPAPEPRNTARPIGRWHHRPLPRDRRRVPPAEARRGARAVIDTSSRRGRRRLWLWRTPASSRAASPRRPYARGMRPGCGSKPSVPLHQPGSATMESRWPACSPAGSRRPRARRAALDGAGRRSAIIAPTLLRAPVVGAGLLAGETRSTMRAVRRLDQVARWPRRRHRGCGRCRGPRTVALDGGRRQRLLDSVTDPDVRAAVAGWSASARSASTPARSTASPAWAGGRLPVSRRWLEPTPWCCRPGDAPTPLLADALAGGSRPAARRIALRWSGPRL